MADLPCTFFVQFYRTLAVNMSDANLRSSLSVTRVLYLVRCFMADSPLDDMRQIFWGFAVSVSDLCLSDEDIPTVI
jgi:hypothetical protein